MTRSRLGDQISAHISKSARGKDCRYLLAIIYEVQDESRRENFESQIKKLFNQDGRGYWHAMRNVIFIKLPLEDQKHSACGVHPDLMKFLKQEEDQLIVLGPLSGVDTDDWGLNIEDAKDFGRALV